MPSTTEPTRTPRSVRIVRRLYALLARLLPGSFRRGYFDQGSADLDDTLREVHERDGSWAVFRHGLAALADLAGRVPVEWWAARARGRDDPGRVLRPPVGEWTMMRMSDLRVAARALWRRPTYTLAAIVTLALGIGATAAIFTVVNAVVVRPLPYPDADRIVTITHHARALNLPNLENAPGTLRYYAQRADFLEALAAYRIQARNFIGGPSPERISVTAATPEIFRVLGVQPALGRPFNETDGAPGAHAVALLTHDAWVSRFGADPRILGRTVILDDVSTEIVGVMPRGFAFPDADEILLTPLYIDPGGPFGTFGFKVVARLAGVVTIAGAQRRIEELQGGFSEAFPEFGGFLERAGWSVSLERLQDRIVGADIARALWIVFATVGFVLLIACANVANLFLVRAESRQKEMAVRTAMGAGRGHVASALLAEALLLGGFGGALGVGMAQAGVALLVSHGPSALPRLDEVSLDGTSLAMAAAIAVLAVLALGAVGWLRYSGHLMAGILRDGGRGSTEGQKRHRTRSALVASQLALAVILLVGSALMLRTYDRLRSVDLGFDPEDVLTVGLSLARAESSSEAASFYRRVADQVAALPGVRKTGLGTAIPMGSGSRNGGSLFIEGTVPPDEEVPPTAMYEAIGADYLEALRMPLLQGRGLTRADGSNGEPVALVNKAFADRYLDGNAVGKGIKWDSAAAYARVVGVVGNVREWGLREEVQPWAYLPMMEGAWGLPAPNPMYLVIRSDPGMSPSLGAVREIVAKIDPSVPLTTARTMDELVARDMADTSFTMVLLGIASAVALFLGAVGLFGVISYVVAQRTREIGVRVALGARGEDIRAMVLRQSTAVATSGVTVGLLGAFALTRLMGAVLFEVSTTDLLSFTTAPLVLLAVAWIATWLPARRASRVDPVEALRAE